MVSLAVAAAILGDSLLYAALPVIYEDLGLAVGLVGVLLSANRFVRLVSNPIAGWVVSRVGVRGPFLAAVFAAALTTAAYASGLGFVVLFLARCAWGICWSFLRLGGYLAALEAAHDGNRGYYLGFFNGVVRFGSFVAVLLGGLLTDLIGFNATVLAFTAVSLLGGFAILGERPPPTADEASNRPVGAEREQSTTHQRGEPIPRSIRVVFGAGFLHAFAISGLVTATLGLWLLNSYGRTTAMLGLVIGVATLTGVLLSARFLCDFLWGPVVGHFADRFGAPRVTVLAGLFEIGALFMLAIPLSLLWTILAAITLFIAATAVQVSLDAMAGRLAPSKRRAQVLGWYTTAHDLGSASGPLIGFAMSVGIGLGWMYASAATLLAMIGAVYLGVFRTEIWRQAPAPLPLAED